MQGRGRRGILVGLGFVLLAGGICCALLGPLEVSAFSLFSEGGRFAYEGFGFGSFLFASIVLQVAAYYGAAAVLVPLGYGHVRLRRWARPVAEALLWTWAVLGVPLLLVLFFLTASVKQFSVPRAVLFVALLALSYLVLPWVGIRFYRGQAVREAFEAQGGGPGALEAQPVAVLVLCLLDLVFLAALHVPLLFRGFFPLFGMLQGGMAGTYLIDTSVLVLAVLAWGTWERRPWAWWGSAAYYLVMTASWMVTMARTPYGELLAWLKLPPLEMEALSGMPLRGWEIGVFVGLPMLACAGMAVGSRKWFGGREGHSPGRTTISRPS